MTESRGNGSNGAASPLAAVDWSALRDFLAVAEAGSLSGAARRLGVSQPTLTRRMAGLEARLGSELFRRNARGLELTEAGEAVLGPAREIEQRVRAMELSVTGRDQALAGPVRITATEGLAIDWLTPELATFQARHPAIEIHFVIRNTNVNLLEREADIAVRLGRPRQMDLVARRVGDLAYGLYASRAYLDAKGRPRNDEDLRDHRSVLFSDELDRTALGAWLRESLGPARVAYRANSLQAQLAALRAGFGIGGQAPFIASRRPDLERVLPERTSLLDIWLVSHPGLRRSARMRAVYDFLVDRFAEAADALSEQRKPEATSPSGASRTRRSRKKTRSRS